MCFPAALTSVDNIELLIEAILPLVLQSDYYDSNVDYLVVEVSAFSGKRYHSAWFKLVVWIFLKLFGKWILSWIFRFKTLCYGEIKLIMAMLRSNLQNLKKGP